MRASDYLKRENATTALLRLLASLGIPRDNSTISNFEVQSFLHKQVQSKSEQ